LLTYLLSLLIY